MNPNIEILNGRKRKSHLKTLWNIYRFLVSTPLARKKGFDLGDSIMSRLDLL